MSSGDLHISLQPEVDEPWPFVPVGSPLALVRAPAPRTYPTGKYPNAITTPCQLQSAPFYARPLPAMPRHARLKALALHHRSSYSLKNTEDIVPSGVPGGLVQSAVGVSTIGRVQGSGPSPMAGLRSCHQCNLAHQQPNTNQQPINERIGARAKGPWFPWTWSIAGTGNSSVFRIRKISHVALMTEPFPHFELRRKYEQET
jgi:hypothetical protein